MTQRLERNLVVVLADQVEGVRVEKSILGADRRPGTVPSAKQAEEEVLPGCRIEHFTLGLGTLIGAARIAVSSSAVQ
jgi:hypothetical protein